MLPARNAQLLSYILLQATLPNAPLHRFSATHAHEELEVSTSRAADGMVWVQPVPGIGASFLLLNDTQACTALHAAAGGSSACYTTVPGAQLTDGFLMQPTHPLLWPSQPQPQLNSNSAPEPGSEPAHASTPPVAMPVGWHYALVPTVPMPLSAYNAEIERITSGRQCSFSGISLPTDLQRFPTASTEAATPEQPAAQNQMGQLLDLDGASRPSDQLTYLAWSALCAMASTPRGQRSHQASVSQSSQSAASDSSSAVNDSVRVAALSAALTLSACDPGLDFVLREPWLARFVLHAVQRHRTHYTIPTDWAEAMLLLAVHEHTPVDMRADSPPQVCICSGQQHAS